MVINPRRLVADQQMHWSWVRAEPGLTSGIYLADLLREEVIEGFNGGELVVSDVEDGIELGHIKNVVDLLGEVKEFEFAAGIADGSVAADQFSDAGTVDVVDVSKVEDDFFLALSNEVTNGGAKFSDFVPENDAALNVEDGDVGDFAGFDFERHSQ